MRELKLFFLFTFTLLFLFQSSTSPEIVFQEVLWNFPLPKNSLLFSMNQTVRAELIVVGAVQYFHIAYIQNGSAPNLNNTSFYRGDVYTVSGGNGSGNAVQIAYIKKAPGLVKVQMGLFINNIKKIETFAVVGQFDRGYTFSELYTTKACQIVSISLSWQNNPKFSFVLDEQDAFNPNLP